MYIIKSTITYVKNIKKITLFFTAVANICKNRFVFSGSWPATTFDGFKFTGWLVTIAKDTNFKANYKKIIYWFFDTCSK